MLGEEAVETADEQEEQEEQEEQPCKRQRLNKPMQNEEHEKS